MIPEIRAENRLRALTKVQAAKAIGRPPVDETKPHWRDKVQKVANFRDHFLEHIKKTSGDLKGTSSAQHLKKATLDGEPVTFSSFEGTLAVNGKSVRKYALTYAKRYQFVKVQTVQSWDYFQDHQGNLFTVRKDGVTFEKRSLSVTASVGRRPVESANSSSSQVDEFLKLIQQHLKQRGFKRTQSVKQSALYEWRFEREADNRVIEISGWHGTGAYGKEKSVFTLTDSSPNPRTKADSYGRVFDLKEVAVGDKHDEQLAKMTAYIKAVK